MFSNLKPFICTSTTDWVLVDISQIFYFYFFIKALAVSQKYEPPQTEVALGSSNQKLKKKFYKEWKLIHMTENENIGIPRICGNIKTKKKGEVSSRSPQRHCLAFS